jgi:hypothetical protein
MEYSLLIIETVADNQKNISICKKIINKAYGIKNYLYLASVYGHERTDK